MKSFLELYESEEKGKKPVVISFGRFNPPTTGHLKLIDKVKSTAEKLKAKHTVVVSHSQDAKKNPLSGAQKVKHLKRYAPGANIESSSKDSPTIMHHAAKLHAAGHDELHVVAGSDRVKEMHDLLHKYNGVKGKHGHYNFKKIKVHSAGHRDPDAEGAEGMSGTKMREHAKNKDSSSFRQGVPSHVSDAHAKELMKDVRKGMGLHEEIDRGQFRAIFVTGGPGSGKDIVIREAIAESTIVELNLIQACDYLADKQKLSEKSNDLRREGIRSRGPLIINGPADDLERIAYIKEELEELGYETLMIFVNTTNEASKERNSQLTRMMTESIRQDKWLKAQKNTKYFTEAFTNFIEFDNTDKKETKEEDITEIYLTTEVFLDTKVYNEIANDWNERNQVSPTQRFVSLFKEYNVKPNSKSIQTKTVGKYNDSYRTAKGPADITPDNSGSLVSGQDSIKGDTGSRKKTTSSVTGGAWSGAYEETQPTLKINPPPKEPNFRQDKEKQKLKKFGDRTVSPSRVGRPDGLGQSYDTRAGGQGAAAGAGLGQAMGEDQEYSNAQPSSSALPGSSVMSPNPLSSNWEPKKKDFKNFRNTIKKESIDSPAESGSMGVGGVLGGSTNKEPMGNNKGNLIGIEIKKKKKFSEDHVKELETGLEKLDSHGYDTIHKLMMRISKENGITGKDLHNDFKSKHGKIPDDWIKDKKGE
jgi:hypothetical protein